MRPPNTLRGLSNHAYKKSVMVNGRHFGNIEQEGQHPLTGQRAANFRLLANQ